MQYKYILCDADDTLLDFPEAERRAFKESITEFGVTFTDEIYDILGEDIDLYGYHWLGVIYLELR